MKMVKHRDSSLFIVPQAGINDNQLPPRFDDESLDRSSQHPPLIDKVRCEPFRLKDEIRIDGIEYEFGEEGADFHDTGDFGLSYSP